MRSVNAQAIPGLKPGDEFHIGRERYRVVSYDFQQNAYRATLIEDHAETELRTLIAVHEQELRKPLSDAIRGVIRTGLDIPEGVPVPSEVFDEAASVVLRHLISGRPADQH